MKSQKIPYSLAALKVKIERARTVQELQLAGEEAKTAPEGDKGLLRQLWQTRLKEIQVAQAKVPEGWK